MDKSERIEANRHNRQIRERLARASFRLEMAELERIWAIVSAHHEGWSMRDIAKHVGLSPTRVYQIISNPNAAFIENALSVLRENGWPAPEDPTGCADEQIADRLVDESAALISCVKWLEAIEAGKTPVVNLRPEEDWPDINNVIVDQERIIRIIKRIANDIDELARARRVADLSSSIADVDPLLFRRRQLCELPIKAPKGPLSVPQYHRAWDEYERQLKRAGLPSPPNPFRHFDRSEK